MKSNQLTPLVLGASLVLALTGCPKQSARLAPDTQDAGGMQSSRVAAGSLASVGGRTGGGVSGAPAASSACVADGDGGAADDAPVLHPHTILLWPPNHKLHEIAVEDCVDARDACGRPLTGEFIWGSSDEPSDAIGDGHQAPDIVVGSDCKRVAVRAERQGPSDGRVYKLGVRVFGAGGASVEAECTVIVAHDQGKGEGVDSGEAYRLKFDGTNGQVACGNPPEMPEMPETPPPPAPPETDGQPLPS